MPIPTLRKHKDRASHEVELSERPRVEHAARHELAMLNDMHRRHGHCFLVAVQSDGSKPPETHDGANDEDREPGCSSHGSRSVRTLRRSNKVLNCFNIRTSIDSPLSATIGCASSPPAGTPRQTLHWVRRPGARYPLVPSCYRQRARRQHAGDQRATTSSRASSDGTHPLPMAPVPPQPAQAARGFRSIKSQAGFDRIYRTGVEVVRCRKITCSLGPSGFFTEDCHLALRWSTPRVGIT